MNILHMKYAVEVAKIGSIRKAAESLFMAQPNLSRSIKELESDLGIAIFDRSAKGMCLTPDGKEFIEYAEKILDEINYIEEKYKKNTVIKQRFSISVPRADYISGAFSVFTKNIDMNPAEIFFLETDSLSAINNVLSGECKLGIVRYAANYHKYFKCLFDEKGLVSEIVAEFRRKIVVSSKSVLADKDKIALTDLKNFIEIIYNDYYIPSVPAEKIKKEESEENTDRRIYMHDRGSRFDLLAENPETFMWTSPVPDNMIKRYGLVMKDCEYNDKIYKDVLIHKKDYYLSEPDKQFLTELCMAKRKCM